jgi:hypothetical protein
VSKEFLCDDYWIISDRDGWGTPSYIYFYLITIICLFLCCCAGIIQLIKSAFTQNAIVIEEELMGPLPEPEEKDQQSSDDSNIALDGLDSQPDGHD